MATVTPRHKGTDTMRTHPILSDNGFAKLVEATRDDPVPYTYTLLLGDVGLRPIEALGLRWEDVDLAERVGWARKGKGGPHEFPISRRLATALAEHRKAGGRSSPFVFPGAGRVRGGHPLAPRLRQVLQAVAAEAGLPKPFHLVSLRRRCFLRWSCIGHPEHVIRWALGYPGKHREGPVRKDDLRRLVDIWDPEEN